MAGEARRLCIGLLGTVEVYECEVVGTIAGVMPRALLARLALQPGRVIPRDVLIDDLWPGEQPRDPAGTLRVHLSKLRAQLVAITGSTLIERLAGGWRLGLDADCVDVPVFEQCTSRGNEAVRAQDWQRAHDAFGAALALWRGVPFSDLPGLPCFALPNAHLDRVHREAEDGWIDANLRLGKGAEISAWLANRHADDPTDERLGVDLARALVQARRPSDATAVLDRTRRAIADAGLRPSSVLVDFEMSTRARERRSESIPLQVRHERLIGRDAELTRLHDLFDALHAPAFVAVVGEAGIGKTALVEAFLANVAARATIWSSHCTPDALVPFQALATALRGLGLTAPSADEDRAATLDSIVSNWPSEWAEHPVILTIDDAHWIDPGSVAVLRHLHDHLVGARLLVLMTIREPDAASNRELTELVVGCRRRGTWHGLELHGLDAATTTELARRHVMPRAMEPSGADLIRLTGGNPLFVLEWCRHSQTTKERVPRTVADIYDQRLVRLGDDERRILESAAVLGPDGSTAALADILDADPLRVAEALDDGVRSFLIREAHSAVGAYEFVHDLAREAIARRVGTGRRQVLHRRAADRAITTSPADWFAAVSHLRRAGDLVEPRQFAHALSEAARTALAAMDFERAAVLAREGQGLLPPDIAGDGPNETVPGTLRIVEALAELRMGHPQKGFDRLDRSVPEGAALAIHTMIVRLLLSGRRSSHWVATDLPRTQGPIERLWEVIARLRTQGYSDDIVAEADAVVDGIGETVEPMFLLPALYLRQVIGRAVFEVPATCRDRADHALAIADAQDPPVIAGLHRCFRRDALMRAGLPGVATDPTYGPGSERLDRTSAWIRRSQAAGLLIAQDRLAEARPEIDAALADGLAAGALDAREVYATQLLALHLADGTAGSLAPLTANRAASDPHPISQWVAARTECAAGDFSSARARVVPLVARLHGPRAPDHWLWLPQLAIAAEVAWLLADPALGAGVARQLEPFADQFAVLGSAGTVQFGSMLRPLGLALVAAGQVERGRQALEQSVDVHREAGFRLFERLANEALDGRRRALTIGSRRSGRVIGESSRSVRDLTSEGGSAEH